MQTLGLSGRIGSGKSAAAKILADCFGFGVIELDHLGHHALLDPTVRARLTDLFSDEIIASDGQISRPKLGSIVFSDAKKLQQLNQVVHPVIYDRCRDQVNVCRTNQQNALIVGALILEIGLSDQCDTIIVIDVPDDKLKRRLGNRASVLFHQRSRKKYLEEGDIIITNRFDASFETELIKAVNPLIG